MFGIMKSRSKPVWRCDKCDEKKDSYRKPSKFSPDICQYCAFDIKAAAKDFHDKLTVVASLIAGGLANYRDPYRNELPEHEDVAKKSWALAEAVLTSDPGMTNILERTKALWHRKS